MASLGLVTNACGDSSKDGTALVRQIRPYPSQPLSVDVSGSGTIPASAFGLTDNAVAAALLASPISVTFSGVMEATKARGDVDAEAGPLSLSGKLVSVGGTSYLQTGSSWYTLGTVFDPMTVAALPTRLRDVLKSPKIVGTEDVEGTQTQHVKAELDLGRAATLVGSETGAAIASTGVKVVSGSADLYIDANHEVRRAEVVVDGRTKDDKDVHLDLTLTVTPGPAFDVTAPAAPKPIAELPSDLAQGVLGRGGSTTTPSLLPAAP